MTASSGYQPLDLQSVLAFAAPYLQGPPQHASEIGDGNLNMVYRVSGEHGSVIVKQALPYLRVAGEAWKLTRHRSRIEAEAIEIHDKLAPGVLPHVLAFDESLSAMVLEDLTEHVCWREALIAGHDIPGVAHQVGEYSAAVLLGTSEVKLPSRERLALRRDFHYSELCLVTEELIFTAPYQISESNRYDDALADQVAELHRDRALRAAAVELRSEFRTRDQALIHGDLHTGSMMVRPGDVRVIDLEFAYFGPFGFDPGLLLANLAISRLAHGAAGRDAFARVVDGYALDYWNSLADHTHALWDPAQPWYLRFLDRLLGDAARFAGLEMIRRMVGLAHAKDIDVLPDDARLIAQTKALSAGRQLILGGPVHSIDDLWQRAVGEEQDG